LRTKACITPADLRGTSLLTLMPEYRLAEQVGAIAAEVGANVLRDYEGTSLDAIRQMAGMGMGLALLPDLDVRQGVREGGDVVVRPGKGGRYYRGIGLLWRQGAGRAPAFGLIAELLRAAGA
ncbi:LysR substrate-binding domain-containing protein, partial [Xanthomonas campestris]|uniref:LysR substrate-binding domain-containing protein n=1 Tax=Xanthomonas campestris TaxID=339 RepID=UPI00403A1638